MFPSAAMMKCEVRGLVDIEAHDVRVGIFAFDAAGAVCDVNIASLAPIFAPGVLDDPIAALAVIISDAIRGAGAERIGALALVDALLVVVGRGTHIPRYRNGARRQTLFESLLRVALTDAFAGAIVAFFPVRPIFALPRAADVLSHVLEAG